MIDPGEKEEYQEAGDDLLKDYGEYIKKINEYAIDEFDIPIANEVQKAIDNLIEVIGNNLIMLNKIMDEKEDIKTEITADTDHPYLKTMEGSRRIREFLRTDEKEYIIRLQNERKLKAMICFLLDKIEDLLKAVEEEGIDVKEIGPEERKEIKEVEKEEDNKDIEKLAEFIDEYVEIKKDKNLTKKYIRLAMVKKKVIGILGNEHWVKDTFEKYTGDQLG